MIFILNPEMYANYQPSVRICGEGIVEQSVLKYNDTVQYNTVES